jgi:membrane-bound serine protease (ClpP class)
MSRLFSPLFIFLLAGLFSAAAPTAHAQKATTTTAERTAPSSLPAAEPAGVAGAGKTDYVIPVNGEFENALHLIMVRAMRQAADHGAAAIILDMNTPGGRVDSAIKIRDLLIQSKIRTYTYVNPMAISAGSFIAMATDVIVMGPNGSIGGALPITVSPAGANAADEKFQSVFSAEMRKTAKTKNHPVEIAEGFCNPKKVIPGLKKEGEILTLDFDQATSYGLAAYQAKSIEDLLAREHLAGATIERFQVTPTDRLARFLSSSVILGLLMLIGLSGIFIELKSPGAILPGAIGVIAIALYFLGSYLANMSGYFEWLLFLLGVILLALEIYVIPGFGVAGVAGILLIVGSLFMALISFGPDGFSLDDLRIEMMARAGFTLFLGLIGMIIAVILLARYLPHTPGMKWLILEPLRTTPPGTPAAPEIDAADLHSLKIGDRGTTASLLRPSGVALFADRRVDVLTEGDYLKPDVEVEIYRIEGSRIFVRRPKENV